ncbi:MAG TPA: thiamine-phosphate kinase [Gemmatimonadales bacterium]|nr:thiamine-phosphate kinase [Gemmatimonadales bacterium]
MRPAGGSSEPLALGPGAEFDRIRGIAHALGDRARGLGDDCALLPIGSATLALSTDISVEGVHFRVDWIEPAEIGWRAAAAALSDLAAEGAQPLGVLSAVVVPQGATDGDVVEVAGGIGEAAAAMGAVVLGGDLSRGPVWSVAVTVVGRAERPVTRAGARPGDGVWVTGVLGGARAAVSAWRRGAVPADDARRAFARPEPRITAGLWLAAHGARSMLDISDGLAGDAAHLAAASDVRLRLTLEAVPVASAAIAEARRLGLPVQQFAAEGGEDFELLVVLPPEFGDAEVREFEVACGIALTRVGRVERGSGVRAELLGRSLELHGYDHFR